MQKFVLPTSAGRTLGSLGHEEAAVVERDGDRAAGAGGHRRLELIVRTPVASTLSFTFTGADQLLPPSVDWVNLTSIWVPSQSS